MDVDLTSFGRVLLALTAMGTIGILVLAQTDGGPTTETVWLSILVVGMLGGAPVIKLLKEYQDGGT